MKLISAIRQHRVFYLVLLALTLRLFSITNPVGDWHAFRQADTASVTNEFVKNGVDLLHPKYLDLSNIQSGLDNLDGYRMVEFPFINALTATLLRLVPVLDWVLIQRLISVAFSLGTLVSLFKLVQIESGKKTATWTALFFACLPFSMYYSRVILPEPPFIFLSTFSILAWAMYWKYKENRFFIGSLISLILAFLLKPYVAFLAPVYFIIAWKAGKFKSIFHPKTILFAILAILPFLWWRKWISQFPSGIPASDWLFNSDGIRFRPAWFRWIFYERITKLMLGWVGIFFGIAAIKKLFQTPILLAWWIGLLAYLITLATGNVRHDYYQVILIPPLVWTLGLGANKLWQMKSKFAKPLVMLIFGMTMFLSWQNVKGYYNINHWEYVRAGKFVDQNLPLDAKLIAPAMGDTMFLFQTNRTGWPIGYEIDQKIKLGATHYLTTSYDDEAHQLENQYTTIEKNAEFLLLDLTKPLLETQTSP